MIPPNCGYISRIPVVVIPPADAVLDDLPMLPESVIKTASAPETYEGFQLLRKHRELLVSVANEFGDKEFRSQEWGLALHNAVNASGLDLGSKEDVCKKIGAAIHFWVGQYYIASPIRYPLRWAICEWKEFWSKTFSTSFPQMSPDSHKFKFPAQSAMQLRLEKAVTSDGPKKIAQTFAGRELRESQIRAETRKMIEQNAAWVGSANGTNTQEKTTNLFRQIMLGLLTCAMELGMGVKSLHVAAVTSPDHKSPHSNTAAAAKK